METLEQYEARLARYRAKAPATIDPYTLPAAIGAWDNTPCIVRRQYGVKCRGEK